MKRILIFALCLLMLLPLASCAAQPEQTQTLEQTQTKEENKNADKDKGEEATSSGKEYNHKVTDPLTQDDLDAIPIAKPGMSTEQLRQICVDFFDLSMTFTFIPDQNYNYTVESQGLKRTLEKGKLTGGIPYITVGHGNLYRIMDYYDSETGILNMSPFLADYKVLGNACSGGASYGWARCINSVTKFQWTWGMTHANGFLKVGPYEYDLTLKSIGQNEGDYGTPEIVAKNGKQVMFESYAATHKADGIVNTGHVRMIAEEPIVVKNEDGTINGEKSFLVCHDQICYNTKAEKYQRTQSDGTTYHIAGGNNWKYSFNELVGTNYIPFTFAEFLGTDPVEESVITFSHTAPTATVFDLNNAVVGANYIISDVYFKVKDANGAQVFSYSKNNGSFMKNDMKLQGKVPMSGMAQYADGNHTVEISVQLGTGERPVFYTGTLVAQS